jgi:hypothetical protein
MPTTYEPIATTTLGSNTTQISFTSISGTYTDLILVANCGKKNNVANTINVRVNSDSGSNYSSTRLYNSGSGVASDRFSSNSNMYTQTVAYNSVESVMTFMFMNYSNTTTYKTMLARQSTSSLGDGGAAASVGLWRSTSAITSIQLELDFGSGNQFITGSTFTLYGIKAA